MPAVKAEKVVGNIFEAYGELFNVHHHDPNAIKIK